MASFGDLLYVFWMLRCFGIFWYTVSFLVSFSFCVVSILFLLFQFFNLCFLCRYSFDWFCWFVFDAFLVGDLDLLLECFEVKDWSFCCSFGLSPVRFVFWLILFDAISVLFFKMLAYGVLYCCGLWFFFISLSIRLML